MSAFLGIVLLVLSAVIILSLLFMFFRTFLLLLPVALIAIAIIGLVYWLNKRKNKSTMTSATDFTWFKQDATTSKSSRKPARDVTTKDINK